MTDALGDSARAARTAVHALEARGGYVEGFEAGRGLRAWRPGQGVVTASTQGAVPGARVRREEDFAGAAEAAVLPGTGVLGHVLGHGGTALTPGDEACVARACVRDFVRHLWGLLSHVMACLHAAALAAMPHGDGPVGAGTATALTACIDAAWTVSGLLEAAVCRPAPIHPGGRP